MSFIFIQFIAQKRDNTNCFQDSCSEDVSMMIMMHLMSMNLEIPILMAYIILRCIYIMSRNNQYDFIFGKSV